MRPLLLALLLAAGCASLPPQRVVPLTEDEAWSWVELQHGIRQAQARFVAAITSAHHMPEGSSFDPSRGVMVAPAGPVTTPP